MPPRLPLAASRIWRSRSRAFRRKRSRWLRLSPRWRKRIQSDAVGHQASRGPSTRGAPQHPGLQAKNLSCRMRRVIRRETLWRKNRPAVRCAEGSRSWALQLLLTNAFSTAGRRRLLETTHDLGPDLVERDREKGDAGGVHATSLRLAATSLLQQQLVLLGRLAFSLRLESRVRTPSPAPVER